MAVDDRLEVLSPKLLDDHREQVIELKQIAHLVHQEFGWHYLLDLAWIISNLDLGELKDVLDAGAGLGIMQWYLASMGINVLSVDRGDRSDLAPHFRRWFNVEGLRPGDLAGTGETLLGRFRHRRGAAQKFKGLGRDVIHLSKPRSVLPGSGTVTLYHEDLRTLTDVPDNSFDAIVAVSSLEHNPPENLPAVVAELMRVLKPGGKLVATLSTIGNQDGYHEPSSGWVYSEASMKFNFGLDESTLSNYGDYPLLLEQLKNSTELRDGLAKFYSKTGEGGMPWGIWDPQYVPVGVCKVKPAAVQEGN
jgi:SAM-dependent methyltransferase